LPSSGNDLGSGRKLYGKFLDGITLKCSSGTSNRLENIKANAQSMSAIEYAIKEAVEKGGYKPLYEQDLPDWRFYVCDPSFWQARWKAQGGKLTDECATDIDQAGDWMIAEWKYDWLQFILHLADGKDAESWFAKIDI
jgi:hypothetical protein